MYFLVFKFLVRVFLVALKSEISDVTQQRNTRHDQHLGGQVALEVTHSLCWSQSIINDSTVESTSTQSINNQSISGRIYDKPIRYKCGNQSNLTQNSKIASMWISKVNAVLFNLFHGKCSS